MTPIEYIDKQRDGKAWKSTKRIITVSIFIASAFLLLTALIVPLSYKEATCGTTYTTTTEQTLDDAAKHRSVNITLMAPRYVHTTDSFQIRFTLERDKDKEGNKGYSDQLLLDAFDNEHDVATIDAELMAPGFTVVRLTPQFKGLQVGWVFILTPKAPGRQLYVYRVRMKDSSLQDVSYTAYAGSIDVGDSPFAYANVSTILGLAGTALGLYLQFRNKEVKT